MGPDLMSEIKPVAPSDYTLGIVAFNVESFVEMVEGQHYLENEDVFVFFDSYSCFACHDFYDLFEQVSKKMSSKLTFGYAHLSKNELQEIADVYSFPTLRLYKKAVDSESRL